MLIGCQSCPEAVSDQLLAPAQCLQTVDDPVPGFNSLLERG